MLQDKKKLRRVSVVACSSLIVGTIVTIAMVFVLDFLSSNIPTVFRPIDNSNLLLYNFFIAQILAGSAMIAMHLPFKRYNFSIDKMKIRSFFKYACLTLGVSHALNLFTTIVVIPILDLFTRPSIDPVETLIYDQPIGMIIAFVVILAPIAEELIFRQVILSRLLVLGQRNAIILQGVLFGLFHANLHQFFYTTGMGIILGYITVRFGSFKYAVYLHILLNFMGSIVPLVIVNSDAALVIYGILMIANIIGTLIYIIIKRKVVAFSDEFSSRGNMAYVLKSPIVAILLVLLIAYTVLNSI